MNAEEELEVGEPIADEVEPAPKRLRARPVRFDGKRPAATAAAGEGQVVLASAKYLTPDAYNTESPAGKKPRARPAARAASGPRGFWFGLLMIVLAAVWFVAGLMNDVIYFYPPFMFAAGIGAVLKGSGGGDEE